MIGRTYQVRFTTEDWDEYTYPVQTARGAIAAIETAYVQHSKAGHLLSDVRSVVASASGEHETPNVESEDPEWFTDRTDESAWPEGYGEGRKQ